jgi:dienelactone hydrolase
VRLETEQIVYRDGDGRLTGFLVIDAERAGKRPGVLVVHGGAGVDDHARGRARRFAEAGFVVFACDMYGEGVTGNRERIMRHIGELRTSRGAIVRRVQAASEILLSRPEIDGRMAAVGYCFGGMIVLEYARSGSTISAVVSVHGSLETSQSRQAVIDSRAHSGLPRSARPARADVAGDGVCRGDEERGRGLSVDRLRERDAWLHA